LVGAGLIAGATAQAATIPSPALLTVTPIPTMPEGDFDQFDVDVRTNRLFFSAEDGAAIEVFDLRTGILLQSGGAVGPPHKAIFNPTSRRLLVADGADASVKVLDESWRRLAKFRSARIPTPGRAMSGGG